ncbi:glutaminase liver isoform, mitochondrial-like isoform X1 [Macrobrachium nipponense]|uniref:glutaminase liver isoform, mitochondrial-like isoform X1 n=2 Tax=Macrobrachium nipponense TaxID=159736 RepID=UPI0030C7DC95
MSSPSSWFGALICPPSPDAMKIINTNNNNNISSSSSDNEDTSKNNCCSSPHPNIPNEFSPKALEFDLHQEQQSLMSNEINNQLNNSASTGPTTNDHAHLLQQNHHNLVTSGSVNHDGGTNVQFYVGDKKEEKGLKAPNHLLCRMQRCSREEVSRHRSVDIPLAFPGTNSESISELKGEELAAHLKNLAEQTVKQQQQQQPKQQQQLQEQQQPQQQLRRTGRQENPAMLMVGRRDKKLSRMSDDLFFQTVMSQWIDHSYSPVEYADPFTQNIIEKTEAEEMEKLPRRLSDMSLDDNCCFQRHILVRDSLVRQHLLQVENRLFEMFGDKEKQTINLNKFLMGLIATGLRHSDPRLKEMRNNLKKVQERITPSESQALDVDYETFMGIISDNLEIVVQAFSSSFVIPDFRGFCQHIDEIYGLCQANTDGKVASYIPQLERSNPNHWGVSICTVDGQRHALGDVNIPFTIQSCSKPLNYAMALGMTGTDFIHNFVGMEPSGRYFNELCLDYSNKPHNPMINAGAIMTAALIKPQLSAADRFDYVFNLYKRLVAGEYLGFNNAVFLSERECADRNFALAYFMRENKCFPENTRLHETLDFYFQLCSLEITAESGALIAATLANGGINPLTGDPVLTVEAVRNTLTLMHSCGMYNYSGQFAFKVGLPSKSGVSGCVLVVVPNTMGICLWSPPLDSNGNSCRSVQFCMELVSRFTFHNFDNLRGHISTKTDPRMARAESKAQILFDLLFSAAAGDLSALRRHSLSGTDMEAKDYDGRTALHVAASEGHYNIVEYLLRNCQVAPLPKDRWDRTPLDDARSFGHPRVAGLIEDSCLRRGIPFTSLSEEEVKPELA